jgi:hypothetical protein
MIRPVRTTLLLLSTSLLALAGCAPGLAPVDRAALDGAALDLDRQLTPAGQIAATAAAIAEARGEFPADRFALLGAPQAAETGARSLNLSALDVRATAEDVRIEYVLLPTRDDPTDRMGTLVITRRDEPGLFEAAVSLTRRDDPDHTGRQLDLTRRDQIAVRRLDGRFAIDLEVVERQAEVGPAGDLPLAAPTYTITFTPSPGYEAQVPPELARGYTVTIAE